MRITLTGVHVNDPVEAFQFYTKVLGFVEKVYVPEAKLAIVASSEDTDGTQLLLEPNTHPVAKAYQDGLYKAGLPVIVFGVDDLQAEFVRLRKSGVVFEREPAETEWGIEAVLDDTCGNLIQLYQAKG